jgi:hypothetical protein
VIEPQRLEEPEPFTAMGERADQLKKDLTRIRETLTKTLNDAKLLDLDQLEPAFLEALRDAAAQIVALALQIQATLGAG